MNNETINYCYLAGMLESELNNLAYDEKFLRMKDHSDRLEYVKAIVFKAHNKAKDFEKLVSSR